MASCPSHAFCFILSLVKPDSGEVAFFEALTLLFGETGAVFGFCRVSRALRELLLRKLLLIIFIYVDDFNQLENEALAPSGERTVQPSSSWMGMVILVLAPYSCLSSCNSALVICDGGEEG